MNQIIKNAAEAYAFSTIDLGHLADVIDRESATFYEANVAMHEALEYASALEARKIEAIYVNKYSVKFGDEVLTMDDEELRDFINTAVIKNKDIHNFEVHRIIDVDVDEYGSVSYVYAEN